MGRTARTPLSRPANVLGNYHSFPLSDIRLAGLRLLLALLVDRHAGRLGLVQPLQLADESHRVKPTPQLAGARRVLQLQRARRATAGTSVELQRGSVHGWPVRRRGGV